MFDIVFYKDKANRSEIIEYLDDLGVKAEYDKDARIKRKKILTYMTALSNFGTRIGKPFVKHIEGDIWELRPLDNRFFFFYWKDNKFVMLHHYIKKSKKIPKIEMNQAKKNLKDYIERYGDSNE